VAKTELPVVVPIPATLQESDGQEIASEEAKRREPALVAMSTGSSR